MYGGSAAYGGYPPPPPVAPCYVQSPQYPMLMNPHYMPTYQYGVPPSPVAAMGPQYPGLRRAGSINAKIMSQVSRLESKCDFRPSEDSLSSGRVPTIFQTSGSAF